jgi:hypothetical protein
MKRILPALLALLVAESLFAAPVPEAAGPAPDVAIVTRDGDNLVWDVTVYKAVPVAKEVVVVIDGKATKKVITETQMVPVHETQLLPLKDIRAWTADGKPLDAAALARRLDRKTPVLLSRDGRPLGAAYRGLFRDDAIILALPQSQPPKVPEVLPLQPMDR